MERYVNELSMTDLKTVKQEIWKLNSVDENDVFFNLIFEDTKRKILFCIKELKKRKDKWEISEEEYKEIEWSVKPVFINIAE